MIFIYLFSINGYNVIVTIEFFSHIVVLEDSSLELTNDDSSHSSTHKHLLAPTESFTSFAYTTHSLLMLLTNDSLYSLHILCS